MKLTLIITAVSSLLTSYLAHAEVDLLITGGTIISPVNKHQVETKRGYWLAIKDNRIVEVSSAKLLPKAKQVVNAKGKFLIPGLTDSHTHLKRMPGLSLRYKNAKHMQSAFLNRQGFNYLYYGITQVIDPANTANGIERFKARGLSPDAFFCGAMPVLNGYNASHIKQEQLSEQRPYYIAQDKDPVISEQIKQKHAVTKSVSRAANDGAICAKVYIEDGFDTASNIPMISRQNLNTLTSHAKSLGLPVMAHANATDMQDIAVNSGVNILGHGLWNWLEEQKLNYGEALPPKVTKVLDEIIKQEIAYQPTVNVIRSLRDLMVVEHLNHQQYLTVLPQWQIDWYLSQEGQWFAREMFRDWGGVPIDFIVNKFSLKVINGLKVVKYLYDGGATILLGSDTPPAPTYASQPGLASYIELKSLFEAGIDLSGILAAATLNNAEAYQLQNDYGVLEVGKIANIVLLNSDPLVSVEAYDDIDTVILRGEPIKRSELHIDKLNQAAP